jgi:hypothetical protein
MLYLKATKESKTKLNRREGEKVKFVDSHERQQL